MLSAIRTTGVVAPFVVSGAVNGAVFRTWVEQLLVPSPREGDIVVMDNLASHEVHGVEEAIEGYGAEAWYLPPYSPDLNPIEKVWAKVKHYLRREKTRTFEGL